MSQKTKEQKQIREAIELLITAKNGIDALSEYLTSDKYKRIQERTSPEKIKNKWSKKRSDD